MTIFESEQVLALVESTVADVGSIVLYSFPPVDDVAVGAQLFEIPCYSQPGTAKTAVTAMESRRKVMVTFMSIELDSVSVCFKI